MATAIATRPIDTLTTYLGDHIGELAPMCATGVKPEALIQLAAIVSYKTPKLAECDGPSVLACLIQVASLGLDLNPSAGEAYLIPRWNKNSKSFECTFQVGYQGMTKLARSSGEIRYVKAWVVREHDVFDVAYENGEPTVVHKPAMIEPLGKTTSVYAVAKFTSGDRLIEIMTADEVEYIRSRSKSPDEGPWVSDWNEMAKKTVIRRLCKSLPKTPGLIKAIETHDADYDLSRAEIEEEARPKAIDNQSGHATGKYASPAETAAYMLKADAYLAKRTAEWLDRWTDQTTGEIPEGIKAEVVNRWQLDNHLVKAACDTRRLDPASIPETGVKNAQIGRFSAVVYRRSQTDANWLSLEAKKYIDQQEERATEAMRKSHPELFEPQADGVDPDPPSEPDVFEQAAKAAPAKPASKPFAKPNHQPPAQTAKELKAAEKAEAKTTEPKSELRNWIDEAVADVNNELDGYNAKGITVYQVANAVLNEGIEGGLVNEKAILNPAGKRDKDKAANLLQALWDDDKGWVQDTIGKYLAGKVQAAIPGPQPSGDIAPGTEKYKTVQQAFALTI